MIQRGSAVSITVEQIDCFNVWTSSAKTVGDFFQVQGVVNNTVVKIVSANSQGYSAGSNNGKAS
jgi:hypothetical protein